MFCTTCGAANDDHANACAACGQALVRAPQTPRYANRSPGIERFIPKDNQPALVGYYLGVFSIIPCLGLVLGPAAIVLGYLGLKRARDLPGRQGRTHARFALLAGSVTTAFNVFLFGMTIAAMRGK